MCGRISGGSRVLNKCAYIDAVVLGPVKKRIADVWAILKGSYFGALKRKYDFYSYE